MRFFPLDRFIFRDDHLGDTFAGLNSLYLIGKIYHDDFDFTTMFHLEIIAGRDFSKNNPADSNAMIINEAAVRDALHHVRKTLPAEDHGTIDDLPLYRLTFSLPKRLLPG